MNTYDLGFGKIILLHDGLAEVIINKNIELDDEYVEELHYILRSILKAPLSLLINTINPYSYTFNALKLFGIIPEINKIGFLSYNNSSKIASESILGFRREKELNAKIFDNRTVALEWLMQE